MLPQLWMLEDGQIGIMVGTSQESDEYHLLGCILVVTTDRKVWSHGPDVLVRKAESNTGREQ